MRAFWVLAFVAVAGFLAQAAVQSGPCDMKSVEKAYVCTKCDKELQKTDIKKGKCATCEEKPVAAVICVKKGFACHKAGCSKGPFTKPGG